MNKTALYTLVAVLLMGVLAVNSTLPVGAQTAYTQGIMSPATVLPNGSVSITCYSEPSHPLGVKGFIRVTDPNGAVWFTPIQQFTVGDVNGNGIPDDSLTVTFPGDFPGASTATIGVYTIFCDLWSGPTQGTDPGEATPITAAFWNYFWISFNVVPESIIGAVAPVGAAVAAFMGYRYYSRRR